MMGGRFAQGQGTARFLPLRFGAERTGPASSLQWAIQHVFGVNPYSALTQSWICLCFGSAMFAPSDLRACSMPSCY